MDNDIIEEESDNIISPPRQCLSIPQHEQLRRTPAQSKGVKGQNRESTHKTPQRLSRYKYTTPTRKEKSLEDLFHRGKEVKYYRIIYRGVVALLSKPDVDSRKSGAYVSYGEIVASTNELDITLVESPTKRGCRQESEFTTPKSTYRYSCSTPKSGRSESSSTVSHGQSTTSSSLPLAPSRSFISQKKQALEETQKIRRIIQVDEVLTGGYAIDASTTATSHTHVTPRRSNSRSVTFANPNSASKDQFTAPVTPGRLKTAEKRSAPVRHHGYLFQSRKGMQIAESIPAPPLLCQPGTFYYRVMSRTPLPILVGPCPDAPRTRAMVLPGTVHEISLRMGSLGQPGNGSGLEDGIVYLRLSHRRGWIADRRFVTSLLHPGGNARMLRHQYGRSAAHYGDGPVISLELVMKEVSDLVDVNSFSIQDDISLGGTSISSNSIATPASIISTRRRPTRRRVNKDSRSGMVVQSRKGNLHSIRSGEEVLSPKTDVTFLTDSSSARTQNGGVGDLKRSVENKETSDTLDSVRFSNQNINNPQMKPTIFLMRVTAVSGLKILDAPHFQVNNLIRGQSSGSSLRLKKRDQLAKTMPRKTNPSSIFQTMNGSMYHDSPSNSGGASSWVFDSSGKHRVLPRGALFEASKRIERAGNFAPGSGLISLADNTGWAIIPNQSELRDQYQLHKVNAGIGISENEALKAYEEVGNAVATKGKRSREENILWVRIIQRTGVLVTCSPGSKHDNKEQGLAPLIEHSLSKQHDDSDATSTAGSVFFDAFRSSKKSEPRLDSLTISGNSRIMNLGSGAVIPCGVCVKVKAWVPSSQPEIQSFVKLCRGQGWIPRIIHGAQYSVDIKQPDIRRGSFWFRVQPSNGMKVRVGPSERSPAIKSEYGYFQFECGEYLRASEILTFHGHADTEDDTKTEHPSESFAKLYRKGEAHESSSNYESLSSLTAPGEWVHLHCNGYLYLEECVNPPSIERHQDGWRFEVVNQAGVQIRRGPSFSAVATDSILQYCASVLINEKVTASGESLTWLRLKDGRGWVHNVSDQGDVVMKMHSSQAIVKDSSVHKLISRLGLR